MQRSLFNHKRWRSHRLWARGCCQASHRDCDNTAQNYDKNTRLWDPRYNVAAFQWSSRSGSGHDTPQSGNGSWKSDQKAKKGERGVVLGMTHTMDLCIRQSSVIFNIFPQCVKGMFFSVFAAFPWRPCFSECSFSECGCWASVHGLPWMHWSLIPATEAPFFSRASLFRISNAAPCRGRLDAAFVQMA